MSQVIEAALHLFQQHYDDRFDLTSSDNPNHRIVSIPLESHHDGIRFDYPQLKYDNGPRIFHHGKRTEHVIVLTHGFTDSPYYLQDIALSFLNAGLNVVMPLLPGHGLKYPANALEDKKLDTKWKNTIDHAVEVASMLGDHISLGGFSTGAALSLNKILRDGPAIQGALFLFSAAIGIGDLNEVISRSRFLQSLAKIYDDAIVGEGRDPYSYPQMPNTGGMEVGQIVNENKRLLGSGDKKTMVKNPVFAAHSPHDQTATLEGTLDFMTDHVENGITMVISKNGKRINEKGELVADHLEHGCLPLAKDIVLNDIETLVRDEKSEGDIEKFELKYPPIANPHFEAMMKGVLGFFEREVRGL